MISDTENYKKLKMFFSEEYHSLKAYTNSRINSTVDSDAEDIIQDVALKIFSRSTHMSPIDNITGFVYNSIRNKIIDIMRSKKDKTLPESEANLVEFTEFFYGKSDNLYPEKMKDALKSAIFNLKPDYQDIIFAIDFEGLTYKEIAIKTGIPMGTLMSRRHRALTILFKELDRKKENSN